MSSLREYLQSSIPMELQQDEECVSAEVFKECHLKLTDAIDKLNDMKSEQLSSFLQDDNSKVLVMLVCGCCFGKAHNRSDRLHQSAASFLEEKFLPILNVKDCKTLSQGFPSVISNFLQELKCKLRKDGWKRYPFHRDACAWILLSLTYPELNDFIDVLLPFSLIIIDDYRTDMKILGFECLRHILRHGSKAHMRYTGRSDLIYDSLKRLIYTRDSEVLDQAYSCLLELLETFRRCPSELVMAESQQLTKGDFRTNNRDQYDDLCEKLLLDLSIENHSSVQLVFLKHVGRIIPLMGKAIMKHDIRFMNCVENCLVHSNNVEVQRNMLEILICFIYNCEPVIRDISSCIVKYLIAFVSFSNNSNELVKAVSDVFFAFPCDLQLKETVLIPLNEEMKNDNVTKLIDLIK